MDRIPVPTRLYIQNGQAVLQTVELPPSVYETPFMSEGLQRAMAAAGAELPHVPCPVKELPDEEALPAGLIFHVSRCGSTLVN